MKSTFPQFLVLWFSGSTTGCCFSYPGSIHTSACWEFTMVRLPDDGPFSKYSFRLLVGQPFRKNKSLLSLFKLWHLLNKNLDFSQRSKWLSNSFPRYKHGDIYIGNVIKTYAFDAFYSYLQHDWAGVKIEFLIEQKEVIPIR